jgi:hypothetical protein
VQTHPVSSGIGRFLRKILNIPRKVCASKRELICVSQTCYLFGVLCLLELAPQINHIRLANIYGDKIYRHTCISHVPSLIFSPRNVDGCVTILSSFTLGDTSHRTTFRRDALQLQQILIETPLGHNDDSHRQRRRRLDVLTHTSMTPSHILSNDDLDKTPITTSRHHLSYQRWTAKGSSPSHPRHFAQLVPNQTTWNLNSKQRQTK